MTTSRPRLLKRLRMGTKRPLEEFARDLGVPPTQVEAAEAGTFTLPPQVLWRWAELTGAHPGAVMSRDELRALLHNAVDELSGVALAPTTYVLRASTRVMDADRATQLLKSFHAMSDKHQSALLSTARAIANLSEEGLEQWHHFLLFMRIEQQE